MFNYRLKYNCSNILVDFMLIFHFDFRHYNFKRFNDTCDGISNIFPGEWLTKYWLLVNRCSAHMLNTHAQHTQRHMWINFWSLWSVPPPPEWFALENSIDRSIDHRQAQIVKEINKSKTVQNHKRKWLQFFFVRFFYLLLFGLAFDDSFVNTVPFMSTTLNIHYSNDGVF